MDMPMFFRFTTPMGSMAVGCAPFMLRMGPGAKKHSMTPAIAKTSGDGMLVSCQHSFDCCGVGKDRDRVDKVVGGSNGASSFFVGRM